MLLAELAPNFRRSRHGAITCVEIPASWDDARYRPGWRIETQAAAEIDSPLREAGRRAPIFAERLAEALDDHRVTVDGWLVDVAQYHAVMREPCGAWWAKADQDATMAIARAPGLSR